MNDTLEDISIKYNISYPKLYDLYIYQEYKIIKRKHGLIGYLYINREKYQDQINNTLKRYYKITTQQR